MSWLSTFLGGFFSLKQPCALTSISTAQEKHQQRPGVSLHTASQCLISVPGHHWSLERTDTGHRLSSVTLATADTEAAYYSHFKSKISLTSLKYLLKKCILIALFHLA